MFRQHLNPSAHKHQSAVATQWLSGAQIKICSSNTCTNKILMKVDRPFSAAAAATAVVVVFGSSYDSTHHITFDNIHRLHIDIHLLMFRSFSGVRAERGKRKNVSLSANMLHDYDKMLLCLWLSSLFAFFFLWLICAAPRPIWHSLDECGSA